MAARPVFISYATEDESLAATYASRLGAAGHEVFFAPNALRRDDAQPHAPILDALRRAATVVVLWSPFVDKSGWVVFELSVVATLRLSPRASAPRVIGVDLGGPNMPPWVPLDRWLNRCSPDLLVRTLVAEDAQPGLTNRGAHHRVFVALRDRARLAIDLLTGASAWRSRLRHATPKVRPRLDLSHVSPDVFGEPAVVRLLVDCLWIAMAAAAIAAAATLAAATVIPIPADHLDSALRNVLMAVIAACGTGLMLFVRIGVPAGTAGAVMGATTGAIAALMAAAVSRQGAIATGVAVGATLGTASAVAAALGDGTSIGPRRSIVAGGWLAFAAPAAAVLTYLAVWWSAVWVGASWTDPSWTLRALVGAAIGAVIGLPISMLFGWIRHLQERRRHWTRAATAGAALWVMLCVIAALAAASVPFGRPGELRDGVGVGLIAAGAAGGMTFVIHPAVERLVPEWANAMATNALLIVLAYPLMRLSSNVQAGAGFLSLVVSAAATFAIVVAASRRGRLARPASTAALASRKNQKRVTARNRPAAPTQ